MREAFIKSRLFGDRPEAVWRGVTFGILREAFITTKLFGDRPEAIWPGLHLVFCVRLTSKTSCCETRSEFAVGHDQGLKTGPVQWSPVRFPYSLGS